MKFMLIQMQNFFDEFSKIQTAIAIAVTHLLVLLSFGIRCFVVYLLAGRNEVIVANNDRSDFYTIPNLIKFYWN